MRRNSIGNPKRQSVSLWAFVLFTFALMISFAPASFAKQTVRQCIDICNRRMNGKCVQCCLQQGQEAAPHVLGPCRDRCNKCVDDACKEAKRAATQATADADRTCRDHPRSCDKARRAAVHWEQELSKCLRAADEKCGGNATRNRCLNRCNDALDNVEINGGCGG